MKINNTLHDKIDHSMPLKAYMTVLKMRLNVSIQSRRLSRQIIIAKELL